MAIRQYIGARYVPRFMGTYNSTQLYEVLDVVDNGYGTTYILKKPAPVGTPLTNTTYWALYGSSSGAIVNLQNQIDTINDVTIPALSAAVDHTIPNRRFVFMGDSYDDISGGWISKVVSILGITDYVDISYYGEGFTTTHSWSNRLSEASISNPETVTDLVVCGGANDRAEIANIISEIQDFKTTALTKLPNLKNIFIGAVGFRCNTAPYIRDSSRVASRYKEGCAINGLHYLHNTDYLLMYPTFWDLVGDTNHPNGLGIQFMARGIAQAILTGSCDVQYYFTQTIPFVSGATWFTSSGSGITFDCNFHNGVCEVTVTLPTINIVEGTVSKKAIAYNDQWFNIYACPTQPMGLMYGFQGNTQWCPILLNTNANDMRTIEAYTLMNTTGATIPQTFRYNYNLQSDSF